MSLSDFSEEELVHLIALQLVPGVGVHRMRTLLSSFMTAVHVYEQEAEDIAHLPFFSIALAQRILTQKNLSVAQHALDWIQEQGVGMYSMHDVLYPEWLRRCPDAPYILYVWGNDAVWQRLNEIPLVSVVGTRSATPYGLSQTRQIIHSLSEVYPEMGIVSGMALGIDGCAHEAALCKGMVTLAVLAYGFQHIYPKEHTKMTDQIKEQGVLISEYLPSVPPDRMRFPARNRLIAGIAPATLVIETKVKGGAIITAELAIAYNREVFAVPGDRDREESQGCHALIANHMAHIYVDTDTFLQTMQWQKKESVATKYSSENQSSTEKYETHLPSVPLSPPDLSPIQAQVYAHIKAHPKLHVDVLMDALTLPLTTLAPILLHLEMMDYIESEAGTRYSCKQ